MGQRESREDEHRAVQSRKWNRIIAIRPTPLARAEDNMKTKTEVQNMLTGQMEKLVNDTRNYIEAVNKANIETILLSGSVSRGDYFPGEMGGMIDLVVMKKNGCTVTAEELFGKNEDPDMPFHCVKRYDNWYQIDFVEFVNMSAFKALSEATKYAILESKILFDNSGKYQNELKEIIAYSNVEQESEFDKCLGAIKYMLSNYKKDRWIRREAYSQIHENLNTAINSAVKCMYYINGMYCPAEDRRMYYSFDLEKLPEKYYENIVEIEKQDMKSFEDYERREAIFNNYILEYLIRNRPTTAST
jgi:hypothetical protein